jgi:hypothetical protein
MTPRRAFAALTLATCLTLFTGGARNAARADPITIQFTGTVLAVDPALAGTFAPGQTLTGSYTFESLTAPRAGSTSTFAVFDALTAFNFSIGSYSASSTGAPEIQVDNDPPAPDSDRYGLVSRASDGLTGPAVNGLALDAFALRLDDSTNTVFTDALILPTDISLSTFDSDSFFVFFQGAVVFGDITSISSSVPEPATVALFGLGALGLLGHGWRQRKRVRFS